jgi:hypothetical protein
MNHFPAFTRLVGPVVLGGSLLLLSPSTYAGLFSPKGNSPEEKRQVVRKQRDEMLAQLYKTKPELKERIPKAAGYATFKQTDINLFLLASGRGYGVLKDNQTGKETFMCVGSLGGGVGMGVKDLRVVFVFNSTNVMKQFLQSGWEFGGKGDASAKYKDTGVSAEQNVKANVNIKDGTVAAGSSTDARSGAGTSNQAAANLAAGGPMEIYQFTDSGVSLQATVAGTKYWKDSKLNQ